MRRVDGPRPTLKEEVSGADASEEGRSADHRPAHERRRSRVAAITLALALSAASLLGLWLGFRAGPVDRDSGDAPQAGPVDLQPRVDAVVPVGPFPADVAVGEEAAWVSVPAQAPEQDDLVVRIDAVTNEVVARIPVEDYIEELAAGAGGVWGVGVQGTGPADLTFSVDRIDPATNGRELLSERWLRNDYATPRPTRSVRRLDRLSRFRVVG